jgi:AcrR family transcriptional regulator
MRADAQRNRDQIVSSALRLFAERGPAVSMEDIAREAGLGVGTLYRHFPDRQALVLDIGAGALQDLVAFGRAVEERDLPAWQALADLVGHCADLPLALAKSLTESIVDDRGLSELEQAADEVFARLVAKAQQEGALRKDILPQDVVKLLSVVVCRPGARAGDQLETVMLDGLRHVNS